MKKLYYILLFLLLSCKTNKDDFSFSVHDTKQLEIEVQSFIDSLKSESPNATDKFRNEEILWWNTAWGGNLKGEPSIITSNVFLNQLKEIENLQIDSLYMDIDTIKGLKNIEIYDSNTELTRTDYYKIALKEGKISEIIKYHFNYTLYPNNRQIVIGGFYMDDTEITSNEYRQFETIQLTKEDSLKLKIESDSFELHWNDYILKQ